MKVLVAGLPITPEKTFDSSRQYNGELDTELKKIENELKQFEKQYNLTLKYNAEDCQNELGCIIFMEDVNLASS